MQFINPTPTFQDYKNQVYQGQNSRPVSDSAWQVQQDWATMYYQNAYNAALMNFQNEYNSPLQQMLRYQEAGINPFLAATNEGNMSSAIPGSSPKGNFTAPSNLEGIKTALQGINTLQGVLKTSQEIYDYITYGAPTHAQGLANLGKQGDILDVNLGIAQANQRRYNAEAAWSEYWNTSGGGASSSPRAQYMQASTDRINAQIDQLEALVDVIYPSQQAANAARAALDSYRTALLHGENDSILEIDTGFPQLDSILKSVTLKATKMLKFGGFF